MVACYKTEVLGDVGAEDEERGVELCQVMKESEGVLHLEILEPREYHTFSPSYPQVPKKLHRTGVQLEKFKAECVKVVMFEDKGCYINFLEEMSRATRALKDVSQKLLAEKENTRPTKRAKLECTSPISSNDCGSISSNFSLSSAGSVKSAPSSKTSKTSVLSSLTSSSAKSSSAKSSSIKSLSSSDSSLEKRRCYNPSGKGQHDQVKESQNTQLCYEYNEMRKFYTPKDKRKPYALFLDSQQLTTQKCLMSSCGFTEATCLVPNPYEYDSMVAVKSEGLYNQTLGQLLEEGELIGKHITFAWFDYMNSLDGNVQDKKAGESCPREDISLYLLMHAKPYSLFAVTLSCRHSKYKTHDYTGGTEVVIMRFINDKAREAGFYFSIIPPTCSYGSNMFVYAGVLLPIQEHK
jgi:hypothetical protein